MSPTAQTPDELPTIERREKFCFHCGTDVPCFNACCRDLELVLQPFDVLRLRKALGLSSRDFIHRSGEPTLLDAGFPAIRLKMLEDAEGTCPFVEDAGCSVYPHRPAACRMYPLGRGAGRNAKGEIGDCFVLVKEPHCRGFEGDLKWTPESWQMVQGVHPYNTLGDRYMSLIARRVREQRPLGPDEQNAVFIAAYQPDSWLDVLRSSPILDKAETTPEQKAAILEDEEERLRFALHWLEGFLF